MDQVGPLFACHGLTGNSIAVLVPVNVQMVTMGPPSNWIEGGPGFLRLRRVELGQGVGSAVGFSA